MFLTCSILGQHRIIFKNSFQVLYQNISPKKTHPNFLTQPPNPKNTSPIDDNSCCAETDVKVKVRSKDLRQLLRGNKRKNKSKK